MTWQAEAKDLGIPLYDHELKRPRKKLDVLTDIGNKSVPTLSEPVNVIIEVREVNAIFRQALLDHGASIGLSNVSIEQCIESLIRKNKLISCKRRGIVLKGMKDGDRERTSDRTESESDGTGEGVSGSLPDAERGTGIEGAEEVVEL
jgi:hypothetical protein